MQAAAVLRAAGHEVTLLDALGSPGAGACLAEHGDRSVRRRRRSPSAPDADVQIFCGGFHLLDDSTQPPWLVPATDLVRRAPGVSPHGQLSRT